MQAVGDCLRTWVRTGDRLAVAFSGGLDSSVLLHCLTTLRRQGACGALAAVHVHHGLSPHADAWAAHCSEVCARLGVAWSETRIAVDRNAPEGVEAAARAGRYGALAAVDVDWIMLAHHRDDQAETLLLNLLRGAGVHGAAAMPPRHGRLLRPLLGVGRDQLESYANCHGLRWIEDESNAEQRYTRNFLRQRILPELAHRFPAAAARLADAAGAFAEARDVLDEVALADGAGQTPLPLTVLRGLSPARAANLLTFHLRQQGVRIPGRRWVHEALRQLLEAEADRQLCLSADGRELRRYRDALWLVWPVPSPLPQPWRDVGELPWAGSVIVMRRSVGEGLARRCLAASDVVFGLRQGGETLRLHPGGPRRPVKDLLREAGLPPWQRQRLPLLTIDGRLAWVARLGIDADFLARPEEDGISLEFDAANW